MGLKTMLFIYNPKAGKAHIRSKLAEMIEIFSASGYEITVFPTAKALDAGSAIITRSRDYDLLVVAGGDGTLAEAVTAMIHCKLTLPIGYIPAGSTNDFGSSIRLPKDMIKAAKIAVEGKAFKCDIGIFNRDVFVYIAAFGLFTDVSYETGQDMKNLLGHMAYLLEGMKRLPSIRSYAMKVTCEDRVIRDEFVFGMITNSVSVGGFKRITGNNVKLDDGVFEVTLIRQPKNPLELNNIMMALLNRDIDSEEMYCFNTSWLELESEELLPWTLDGEYGGSHTHVRIENRHRAVTMLVGEEASDVISAE
jgi:YegS/Rv2252/BmrU family lipid kinase